MRIPRRIAAIALALVFLGGEGKAQAQTARTRKSIPLIAAEKKWVAAFLASPKHDSRPLIFRGRILDGEFLHGKPRDVPCKAQAVFSVNFEISEVLVGSYSEGPVKVGYGSCILPLPDPPFHNGNDIIVFARLWTDTSIVRFSSWLPPEKLSALRSAVAHTRRAASAAK